MLGVGAPVVSAFAELGVTLGPARLHNNNTVGIPMRLLSAPAPRQLCGVWGCGSVCISITGQYVTLSKG